MGILNGGFRKVFNSFQAKYRYNVTRQEVEDGQLKKNVKRIGIALAVLVLILVCLCLLWVYHDKSSNSSAGQNSDLDTLRQHREETEALVKGWIHDVYELKNDAGKGYTTSGTVDTISQRGYIMQEIVQKIAIMKSASLSQLQSTMEHQSTFRAVVQDICPSKIVCDAYSRRSPYRTFDGSCNNLNQPEWGMTGRSQQRSLPATYNDDFGSPRMYDYTGGPLPSPRKISNIVHSPRGGRRTDDQTTVMVMAFGQFLSHDIASTPMMDGHHSSVLKCCEGGPTMALSGPFKACFPVHVSNDDQFFHNSSCMTFTRSAPAICEKCKICGRNQINEMTSYVDASQVYGATDAASRRLRTHAGANRGDHGETAKKCRLIMTCTGSKGRNNCHSLGLLMSIGKGLLPKKIGGNCKIMKEQQYCFNAGDGRVNVVPNLSTLHTAFVRLHNQIAQPLSLHNPHWNDEKVYQETRKILIAVMQHIVYNEYLPVILGKDHMQVYNLTTGTDFNAVYDGSVDATASNGFNTAAFRFGHMSVPDEQVSLNDGYEQECITRIEQTYHNPNMTFLYCDGLARWMVHGKGLRSDGLFSNGVRNLLFLSEKNVSFDLAALNIQRGRDHGLPSYNEWRKFCKLPTITMEQFRREGTAIGNFSAENADLFRKIYRHPDDIDIFPGGVKEMTLPGAQVGPTFACMIAHQFRKLKIGDRFYFENPRTETGFTINQLKTIKGLRFAKILCETMNISEIQQDVFKPITKGNQLKKCHEISDIELMLWKEMPQ